MRDNAAPSAFRSTVPGGTIVYAIGDIHGRLDLLRQLEAKIQHDAADIDADRRLIVCLGDYIDRGDDSFGVIEYLMQAAPPSFERICLIGNHEAYVLRVIDDSSVAGNWLDNGGRETLSSYGISAPARIDYAGASEGLQAGLARQAAGISRGVSALSGTKPS